MFAIPLLCLVLLHPANNVFFVSPTGIHGHGDGSFYLPWSSLSEADEMVPDTGATVLVMDGIYEGQTHMNRRFIHHTVFKAFNPYRAVLVNSSKSEQVVTSFGGANFTLEGFEIKRPDSSAIGPLLIQIQKGKLTAENIHIKNNVIHDSYNNDLLKINNDCSGIVVEGNVFYNQSGSDEHMDVNGVRDVIIQDNIFFNDFKGSKRRNSDTSSYIVVKNSADISKNEHVIIRRNVFLNWIGSRNNSFLLIGEDGKSYYEAKDVLVENNLLIGNSSIPMRSAFGVRGGRDIVFRNNTITGNLPATAFAFSIVRTGSNPKNKNIRFYNNIWSDPTGTMGTFSEGTKSDMKDAMLERNLYYNGGQPIPVDHAWLTPSLDRDAVTGDPALGEQTGIVLPRWLPEQSTFISGLSTIRGEFKRLVESYGIPGTGSVAIDVANPATSPPDDILGHSRGISPDIGACEANSVRPEY